MTVTSPSLEDNLRQLLQEFTAGDPMREGVLWTNLSLRELSRRLIALGTPASRRTIRRLLRKLKVGRRTARKKKTMGHHPDRNAQFENIARLRQEYQAAGDPVISIDTKKKELLGNFHRAGQTYTQQTVETFDHDFASAGQGKLIPHGVYDPTRDQASIHLNTSHDTGELCCDSIALWWQEHGQAAYPQAKRLLILCDGGGSNSATQYLFKEDLQGLASRLGPRTARGPLPAVLFQAQPDRTPGVPPHQPSLSGCDLPHRGDRQTIHRGGENPDGPPRDRQALGQDLCDRPQVRGGLQEHHENPLRRPPPEVELPCPAANPMKSGSN